MVLYFKHENVMQNQCFYILSSDNSYDVAFVNMVQKKIEINRVTLPNIKSIEYFSDGCAAICAIIRRILDSMQNGIFLQQVIENTSVWQ